jgi:SNF2 family DNA or RNA helicase
MKFTPRAYQQEMIDHIIRNPRCALFARMGLGKTASVLGALTTLSHVEDVFPVLVLAPLRVAAGVWPAEVRKWDCFQHLRVSTIVGAAAQRKAALEVPADIYTINYDNLPWLVALLGKRWPFRTVVADESTRLKSFRIQQGGVRAGALRLKAPRTKRWINLTGTPSPNGLKDLWGQTWFLDFGQRLGGSYTAFAERWFGLSHDSHTLVPHPHAGTEIQRLLSDLCFAPTNNDLTTLPPVEIDVPVRLPAPVQVIYRSFERKLFAAIGNGVIEATTAMTRTMKCLQLTAGAVYLTDEDGAPKHGQWEAVHDAKLDALESIIEESAGAPVLVVYHFKSELSRLRERFVVKTLDDYKAEERWNRGEIPLLAVHPASAGHGLNLQHGGNVVVFMTCWWNLEEHEQVIERIGPVRQAQAGLDRQVFIYRIVAQNTLDEEVLERLRTKADVQTLLMKAMEKRA